MGQRLARKARFNKHHKPSRRHRDMTIGDKIITGTGQGKGATPRSDFQRKKLGMPTSAAMSKSPQKAMAAT